MENTELLRNLYCVFSPSRGEKKMRKFIKDYIRRNIPGVEVSTDKVGNLYAKKGESDTYPCVVSHIDQVQHEHGKDFRCYTVDGKVFGFSPSAMKMRGLGADDKNGIWVCLQVLAKYDIMKCAFFVGEEIGCVGSSDADMDFFDDCRYVLQCDRRNGGDLITSIWGSLCSDEFLKDTDYESFGYKTTSGLTTDVGTLKDNGLKVSCVNMSCGYYAPHTDEEYTVLSELENCLHFVEHIIETCTKVYPHESMGHSFYGSEYDDDGFRWGRGYYGGSYHGGGKSYGGHYGYKVGVGWTWISDHEEDNDSLWPDDDDDDLPAYSNTDLDEMDNEIFDCLWNGLGEEAIIANLEQSFPRYTHNTYRARINAIRVQYDFPTS